MGLRRKSSRPSSPGKIPLCFLPARLPGCTTLPSASRAVFAGLYPCPDAFPSERSGCGRRIGNVWADRAEGCKSVIILTDERVRGPGEDGAGYRDQFAGRAVRIRSHSRLKAPTPVPALAIGSAGDYATRNIGLIWLFRRPRILAQERGRANKRGIRTRIVSRTRG